MRSESEMNEASGGCGGGMCERTRGHASDRPCHQISDRGVGVDGVIEWPSPAGGVIHLAYVRVRWLGRCSPLPPDNSSICIMHTSIYIIRPSGGSGTHVTEAGHKTTRHGRAIVVLAVFPLGPS